MPKKKKKNPLQSTTCASRLSAQVKKNPLQNTTCASRLSAQVIIPERLEIWKLSMAREDEASSSLVNGQLKIPG